MWSLIFFIAVIYLVYQAFTMNLFLGLGAILAVVAYIYFRWYTEFLIGRARAVYGKDPQKALALFSKAHKKGMNIGQLETYAYYLLREGETEASEEIYQKLLEQKLRPELRLKVRSDYAVLLMKTGRIDEAIEELEEITVNYINTTTYGTLGYLYLLKNNKRKAESFNKEAYEYNDSDPVILDNVTQLYIKLERYEEAKIYADQLIEKKPYFVEGYYDAAYVYMKLGEFSKAEDLIAEGKNCRITFMSTVSLAELSALEECIKAKQQDIPHKLGVFSQAAEETETVAEPLYYADEEEPVIAYENDAYVSDDENDPFI